MSNLKNQIQSQRQEIKSERMDMSFGEIINMYKDNEIIISPEYQRAFRWDIQKQSDFIESILLGIPFPSIFVAANPDGKWELIDGLQRISTVLSFFGELKDSDKNNLILSQGNLLKDLDGVSIETLPLEFKLQIKRTPCRVEVILKESNFKMRYELFKRLNTGGEGLSRQEIRNCIFRGINNEYNAFINELARNTKFRKNVKISERNADKMYYEELVLRYLCLKNKGTSYKLPNIQEYLDSYLEEQTINPNRNLMNMDRVLFNKICDFLDDCDNQTIFKLGSQNVTTSMFDSVMLTLSHVDNIDCIDKNDFLKRIDKLKFDSEFNKYVGSASSTSTSITNKFKNAKRILIDIEE